MCLFARVQVYPAMDRDKIDKSLFGKVETVTTIFRIPVCLNGIVKLVQ